ncbi:MAG: 4Fe-4S dicluster domain-containing protein [Acidithiobacillales bacterium]
MSLDRRKLLKLAAAAGVTAALPGPGGARAALSRPSKDARAVLVDTTNCVGCRSCEMACSEANKLPEPASDVDFESARTTGPNQFTVVNKGTLKSPGGDDRYAKTQCMHCVEPACAAGCVVRALEKEPGGPVIYHANRCLGCRYCMVACPFGVPKYEYGKAAPIVRKCTFCAERQAEGKPPACVEACPNEALVYGSRAELLVEAKKRIYGSPGKYVPHIYGEEEAGGTSWLYISDVPLESLRLQRDVEKRSYPEMAERALSGVPFVITLWPPFLVGLWAMSKRKKAPGAGPRTEEEHDE